MGTETQQATTQTTGAPPPVAPPPAAQAPAATTQQPAASAQAEAAKPAATSILGEVAKPAEQAKPAESTTTGAELELKLPEGFDAKSPMLASFRSVAKEEGLSAKQAQRILDTYTADIKSATEASNTHEAQQRAEWEASLKADKDFGGARYEANIAAVRGLVSRYPSGAAAMKSIDAAGRGSDPAIVKFLGEVAQSMTEGTVRGGGSPPAVKTEAELLAAMYPNTKFPT